MVSKSNDRLELSYTGIYFLIGRDEEQGDNVYIGEAEGILKRINRHISTDEWQDWTECVVFVRMIMSLTRPGKVLGEFPLQTGPRSWQMPS